jgi:hypothetical protein
MRDCFLVELEQLEHKLFEGVDCRHGHLPSRVEADVSEVVLQQLPHMGGQLVEPRNIILQQTIDMPQDEQLSRVH